MIFYIAFGAVALVILIDVTVTLVKRMPKKIQFTKVHDYKYYTYDCPAHVGKINYDTCRMCLCHADFNSKKKIVKCSYFVRKPK